MQEIPVSVRATVEAVSKELRRKPKRREWVKRVVNLRPNWKRRKP
jgi:hypothetical protein